MTTGVNCRVDPHCRHPAPAESRICSEHQKLIRLAAMRKSPSLTVRIIGRARSLLAEYEPEP